MSPERQKAESSPYTILLSLPPSVPIVSLRLGLGEKAVKLFTFYSGSKALAGQKPRGRSWAFDQFFPASVNTSGLSFPPYFPKV